MNKHHNKDCIAAEECNLDWQTVVTADYVVVVVVVVDGVVFDDVVVVEYVVGDVAVVVECN